MTRYPELPPAYALYKGAPRPRFPWLRFGFLLFVGALVVAFLVNSDVRDAARGLAAKGAVWVEEVYAATEPHAPRGVAAEDFTPERAAFASAAGANVRDYPLPHADILVRLPARDPLNITGRLNVQGNWWFRVVLSDGRIGFVHHSVVAWGQPTAQRASATELDEPVLARAGHAGAKIRAGPGRNSRVLVRVDPGTALTIIGWRRVGEQTWYRVETANGQRGYARADVLLARDGGRLRF